MLAPLKRILKEHTFLCYALGITILVYWRVLSFGHISWDDPEMVFKNRAIPAFDLNAFFSESFVGNFLPLTMVLHALVWLGFGSFDGAHHAVNILLHLLNGVLVYKLSKRLFKDQGYGELTALVFLLHPLQIESVGWISELKNVLSASFYFLSLLAYLNFTEHKQRRQYWLSFLFFTAGCLSKSSVVILPLSLLALDVFLNQNFRLNTIVNKIPFFVLSLLFGIVNLKTQAADLFINYSHAFPYHERLGYAGFALLKYSSLFLWPFGLSVLYPYPADKLLALVIGFVFLAVLAAVTVLLLKRQQVRVVALLFLCLSSLILVLQFVPFGEVLYADRYMYVPMVYFTMLLLYSLRFLRNRFTMLFYVAWIGLSAITFFRLDVWKSSVSLYSDILKKFPNSFVALNSLGAEYMMRNEDAKALEYLNKSVAVSPQNYKGHYNKGLLLLKTNRPEEAIASFNSAIQLHDYHKAYIGRASAYYMIQDFPKAMQDANYVLQQDPNHAKALFVIGNCYNSLNRLDTAIVYYNRSIELAADDADFYLRRAIAFGKKQDFSACLTDLNRCIDLNPMLFEAFYWRGVAKMNLDQNPCSDLQVAARNNVDPAVQAYNKYCR